MIETDRLFFRQFTEDDLPWLIENRTPAAVNKYLGGVERQNPEALSLRLKFYISCYDSHGFGMCAMGLKNSGELIGVAGLQPLDGTNDIEVGYSLAERHWRKGYGFECAYGWLKYGFNTAGLERIVALADERNVGSTRIMEKCGMIYEGKKEHFGMSCVLYSIAKKDWPTKRR